MTTFDDGSGAASPPVQVFGGSVLADTNVESVRKAYIDRHGCFLDRLLPGSVVALPAGHRHPPELVASKEISGSYLARLSGIRTPMAFVRFEAASGTCQRASRQPECVCKTSLKIILYGR
jgi:hypothetical protein